MTVGVKENFIWKIRHTAQWRAIVSLIILCIYLYQTLKYSTTSPHLGPRHLFTFWPPVWQNLWPPAIFSTNQISVYHQMCIRDSNYYTYISLNVCFSIQYFSDGWNKKTTVSAVRRTRNLNIGRTSLAAGSLLSLSRSFFLSCFRRTPFALPVRPSLSSLMRHLPILLSYRQRVRAQTHTYTQKVKCIHTLI